jgi:hypothetical protein
MRGCWLKRHACRSRRACSALRLGSLEFSVSPPTPSPELVDGRECARAAFGRLRPRGRWIVTSPFDKLRVTLNGRCWLKRHAGACRSRRACSALRLGSLEFSVSPPNPSPELDEGRECARAAFGRLRPRGGWIVTSPFDKLRVTLNGRRGCWLKRHACRSRRACSALDGLRTLLGFLSPHALSLSKAPRALKYRLQLTDWSVIKVQ